MQSKAIATLAVFALAAVAGCGGGDASTTQVGDRTAAAPVPPPAQEAPRTERKGDTRPPGEETPPEPGSGGVQKPPVTHPVPPAEHHDSGGGSARFKTEGSDNSVQEFGHEAGGAEFAEAAAVFHAFLDARAAGAWDTTCAQLSAGVLKTLELLSKRSQDLEGTSCPRILASTTSPEARRQLRSEADVDVASLRVEGDKAFIVFTGPSGGPPFAFPMAREGSGWKVAALGGAPLL